MKMVERMARAMAEAHGDDYDTLEENRFTKSPGRSDYHKFALAALKAMREPTEEMSEAGEDTFEYDSSDTNGTWFLRDADAAECFTAMIDAAIKEAESE